MTARREFLDPAKSLVSETVRWLAPHVRENAAGARSLSHILVVVPTAQSARNLRLALARAFAPAGVLPPAITMPRDLLADGGSARVATKAEALSTMAEVLLDADIDSLGALFPRPPAGRGPDWALDMAERLLGVATLLGEQAMTMGEVVCPEDAARWRDIASVEKAFFAGLESKGVMPPSLARKAAARRGCTAAGVEQIVLPACVDAQGALVKYLENSSQEVVVLVHAYMSEAGKFDEWGRPVAMFSAGVAPSAISAAPTAVIEADDIARFFRGIPETDALPALAVCDAQMFPELEGAFQNYFSEDELVLRNPSDEPFAQSSLGRLLVGMIDLAGRGDYETFSAFARSGDVARWAASALAVAPEEVARFVGALDAVQNAHLPRTIDEALRGAEAEALSARHEADRHAFAGLVSLVRAIKNELADPFAFLRKIFATVVLDERRPGDRELIAAAAEARRLREECASEAVPARLRRALFARLLGEASYMLEPTAPHVLAALGWLEIPWCDDDELVISGFNEGCVPESVVGHPFVPDSLRARLGLSTNASRACRDSFMLAEAVRCRAPGAVSIHLHQIAGDKNVAKPSRLLFEGVADDDLPALATRLYAVTKGGEGAPPKELPGAWRLKLPIPPRGTVWRERITPTSLDTYLRCPFEFFLNEVFGERKDDRNQELDERTFGSLCHAALDDFAKGAARDLTDEKVVADFLEGALRRRLAIYGESLPAVIELQGEAAIARLRAFAPLQAARRAAGWRIVAAEQSLSCTIKHCPTLIRGTVDRIDLNERTGEIAIIDYKTWRRADEKKRNSVQLPLYRAMVEASGRFDASRARSAKAFYCVLAERAEDTLFDEANAFDEGMQSEAEDTVVRLLEGIARGVFYPPGKESYWKDHYKGLAWEDSEKGIDEGWLEDQAARRAEWERAAADGKEAQQ